MLSADAVQPYVMSLRPFKMRDAHRVTSELYVMICSVPEEVQTCGGPQLAPWQQQLQGSTEDYHIASQFVHN